MAYQRAEVLLRPKPPPPYSGRRGMGSYQIHTGCRAIGQAARVGLGMGFGAGHVQKFRRRRQGMPKLFSLRAAPPACSEPSYTRRGVKEQTMTSMTRAQGARRVFEVSRCRDRVWAWAQLVVFGTWRLPITQRTLQVITGLDVHGPCQVGQQPTQRMRRHGPWGDHGRCIGVCTLGSSTAGIGGGGDIVNRDPP